MKDWYVLTIGSRVLSYASSRSILIASAKELLRDYLKRQVRELELTLSPDHDSEMKVSFYDEPILAIREADLSVGDVEVFQLQGKILYWSTK